MKITKKETGVIISALYLYVFDNSGDPDMDTDTAVNLIGRFNTAYQDSPDDLFQLLKQITQSYADGLKTTTQ